MTVNHIETVGLLWKLEPAEKTVAGALAFTLRVLAALPASERAGLLLKPDGANIAEYKGQMVSVGRICYPDGQVYKVLTDVPTTNGPQWLDNGTVEPARYLAVQGDPPPPPPPVDPTDNRAILDKLDALTALVQAVHDRQWPEYTAPIPAIPLLGNAAGTLVLKPR